jgi:hypothetical protein
MTNETAWWIGTAVLEAPAFQCAIRGHWCVRRDQNHHVRDVTLREDHCRARNEPGVLARLRSMTRCSLGPSPIAIIDNDSQS